MATSGGCSDYWTPTLGFKGRAASCASGQSGYDNHPMRNALLALSLSLALFLCPAVGLTAADAAPKIGILRLAEVLNTSKIYSAGTDKLKKDDAEVRAEMKKLEESLQKLDNQLQVLQPSNENFAKVQEELETTKLKRKIYGERMGNEMQRRHVALVKETYRGVRTALTAFAKERGVMLVLLAPNPELGASTLQEVQLEMGLQTVLYYDPANDITEAFVPYYNDRVTAEAPKPEGK